MSELAMIPVLHSGYIPCANCTLVNAAASRSGKLRVAPVPNATRPHVPGGCSPRGVLRAVRPHARGVLRERDARQHRNPNGPPGRWAQTHLLPGERCGHEGTVDITLDGFRVCPLPLHLSPGCARSANRIRAPHGRGVRRRLAELDALVRGWLPGGGMSDRTLGRYNTVVDNRRHLRIGPG